MVISKRSKSVGTRRTWLCVSPPTFIGFAQHRRLVFYQGVRVTLVRGLGVNRALGFAAQRLLQPEPLSVLVPQDSEWTEARLEMVRMETLGLCFRGASV